MQPLLLLQKPSVTQIKSSLFIESEPTKGNTLQAGTNLKPLQHRLYSVKEKKNQAALRTEEWQSSSSSVKKCP